MDKNEAIRRLKRLRFETDQGYRWNGGPTGPTLPTGAEKMFKDDKLSSLDAIIEALERGEL